MLIDFMLVLAAYQMEC